MNDSQHRASMGVLCRCGIFVPPDLIALGVHLQMEHPEDWDPYVAFLNAIGEETKGLSTKEGIRVIERLGEKFFGTRRFGP